MTLLSRQACKVSKFLVKLGEMQDLVKLSCKAIRTRASSADSMDD